MSISPVGIGYLVLVGVFVPLAAFRSHNALEGGAAAPTFRKIMLGAVLSQLVIVVIALGVARFDHIELFPLLRFDLQHALVSAGVLALALATLPLRWKYKSEKDKQRLAFLIPRSAADLPLWALVSLAAGVCEEIAYRGVLFQVLHRCTSQWSGGWWAAAMLASLAFALAHKVQGWSAVGVVFAFSMVFHALVRLTGDLYHAMAVHFVYDFLAGIILWKLFRSLPARVPAGDPRSGVSERTNPGGRGT